MPVLVNQYLIEPAPFVEINKEVIVAGNQTKLGSTYRLSIQGTLVGWMGSPQGGSLSDVGWGGWNNLFWTQSAPAPTETGVLQFHKLYSIEQKQRALEYLFAQNGSTIEWQSPDGSQPLKAQFKNANVQFPAGNWAQTCPYTITAECDLLYLIGQPVMDTPYSGLIQNANESWQIELSEVVKTFNVIHKANAIGKIAFDTFGNVTQPAWQNARDFILTQLSLGISGSTSFSPIKGGTIFSSSVLASGVLNFANYTAYNYSIVETVDELAGSCDITETFLLSPNASGTHLYTVATRRIVDEPYTTVVSQINGTIHGYYDGLFNYDQRIDAANYFFHNNLAGATGLWYLVSANAPTGLVYNIQPRQGSIDYDYNAGTLNYQYEFSNQMYENDAFEQWTVSRKTSATDYMTTFSINGSIKGRRYDGDIDVSGSFSRAYNYWVTITGTNYYCLYERVLNNKYFPEATGMGVQPLPYNKSIDFNESEGMITYAIDFNNRMNDGNYWSDKVQETYQLNKHFSLDDGITTYTYQGEIQGLNLVDGNSQKSPQVIKFENASGYYYAVASQSGYARLQFLFGDALPYTKPFVNEVAMFPVIGQVTYSQEFRNIFGPFVADAYSEHITVTDANFNKNINEVAIIPVPGRSGGPVVQDVATTQVQTRTVSIEAVFRPTGSYTSLAEAYSFRPTGYDAAIFSLKPVNSFCRNYTNTWDWRYGKLGIQVEWIYT